MLSKFTAMFLFFFSAKGNATFQTTTIKKISPGEEEAVWHNGKSSESDLRKPGFGIQNLHLVMCALGRAPWSTPWQGQPLPPVFQPRSAHVTLGQWLFQAHCNTDWEFLEVWVQPIWDRELMCPLELRSVFGKTEFIKNAINEWESRWGNGYMNQSSCRNYMKEAKFSCCLQSNAEPSEGKKWLTGGPRGAEGNR